MRAGPLIPPPGAHGGDGAKVAAALGLDPSEVLDLSATLNPFAPPIGELLARHLDAARRYPDHTPARDRLAAEIGIEPDHLVLTNGGAEAIALVAAELGSANIVDPEFSLWRRHLAKVDPTAGRVRSNPHSPSGQLAGHSEVAAAWDEAFYQMSAGAWTRGDADKGAYVTGSLTKLYACPGLRLGYVIAPGRAEAARLERARPAWSVNGLALGVLGDLLDRTDLVAWAAQLAEAREELAGIFARHGFEISCGAAPWVLVHGASALREQLARRGVVVRDCGSFGMEGTVRVSVTKEAGLERIDAALDGICGPRWPGGDERALG